MTDEEYERRWRRIDWMLTAHSTLRDRHTRRSRLLTLTVMALSIVGLVLALANDDQQVALLGLSGRLQIFVAILAAITFFISVIDLVVAWPRQASAHADAARRLADLKALYARAVAANGMWAVPGIDLALEYDRVMAASPTIPEKKAISLKALHNRKRELFKRADAQPGAPIWWLRLLVLFGSFRGQAPSDRTPALTGQPTGPTPTQATPPAAPPGGPPVDGSA